MSVLTNTEDLRQLAKRKIPRAIFEYADRGSYDETTLDANRADLKSMHLRQRVMINVDNRSTKTTMLGEPVAMPLAIAPTGLTGLFHANGEILGCQAAQKFGIPFTLSTMSICSIEDVAGAVDKPFWFQLYVMRDRGFSKSLIERAIAARCSALVLTLDLQIQGQRHRDLKNGLSVPPKLTFANALNLMTKPQWGLRMLTSKRRSFGNLQGQIKGSDTLSTLSQWIASQFDASLSWADVEWVRSIWPGKLILKGILDVEDAKIAAGLGAQAIVVSNHGGRQLDGAISSIKALPPIVEVVGDQTEVLFDGGVQSGQDIIKALALGAKGCMMGKAFLYGLGAMGEKGVTIALEIMQKELDVSMALTGVREIGQINQSILHQN